MAKAKQKLITTPPRVKIKKAIFKTLQDFQVDFEDAYKFIVMQDNIGFLQKHDWSSSQRLVVLYLLEVQNEPGYDESIETAQFSIFCAVSPDKNDDTIAFEGLNFLAEQVRCCLWGCGKGLGFSKIMPNDITVTQYSQFSFRLDLENRLSTERVISHGNINFSISYQAQEYSNIDEIFGTGVGVH